MRSYPGYVRHTRFMAVVAGVLLVSGCSVSADPGGPPNESPAASSSPATTDTASVGPTPEPKTPHPATSTSPASNIPAPKMPAAATKLSKEGFEAYVDYWFDTYNYALATGDTKPMERISHKRCGICDHRVQAVDMIHKDGGWAVGGEMSTASFYTQLEKNDQDMYTAGAKVRQEAAMFYGPGGGVSEIESFAAGTAPFDVMAYYRAGSGWQMAIMMVPELDPGAK